MAKLQKEKRMKDNILNLIIEHMSWNQEGAPLSNNDWICVRSRFGWEGCSQLTRIKINQEELAKSICSYIKSCGLINKKV